MKMVQSQGEALEYVAVYPIDYESDKAYPLIVLLHGFGANMHDLAGLASSIDSRSYVYLCPNAPLPIQLGPGFTGYAWTPLPGEKTLQDVRRAEDAVTAFVEEMMRTLGVEAGRVLLAGFSQGGMMTYQVGLPRPKIFAGLAALSARIDEREELLGRLPAERSQRIFIAHGVHDPLIPVEAGRESKDFLRMAGYDPTYREYPMAHQITDDVIDDLSFWIRETLPPAF